MSDKENNADIADIADNADSFGILSSYLTMFDEI